MKGTINDFHQTNDTPVLVVIGVEQQNSEGSLRRATGRRDAPSERIVIGSGASV